jgi:hypothetical protein
MKNQQSNYYISRRSKLLKDFDKTANLMQAYLVQRYGGELSDILYRETRQEYEDLIPEIPYIEGARARALNSFLLITAQELAVYRAMKKHGKGPGEAWEMCQFLKKKGEKTSPETRAIKVW